MGFAGGSSVTLKGGLYRNVSQIALLQALDYVKSAKLLDEGMVFSGEGIQVEVLGRGL